MGGMVVSRFTMLYPENVTHVAMVNQIGLTDSRRAARGETPWPVILCLLLTSQCFVGTGATTPGTGRPRILNMFAASTDRH